MDWKNETLLLSGLVDDSIVDGYGMRYTIFVQGCPHHCEGCHNPQTHPFEGGEIYSLKELMADILENPLLTGVTFSGGEPFCQAEVLAILGEKLQETGLDIWTYSGYTYEQLRNMAVNDRAIADLLAVSDVLVDGPFVLDKRDLELRYRGSSNQRLINLKKMRQMEDMEDIIVWQEEKR